MFTDVIEVDGLHYKVIVGTDSIYAHGLSGTLKMGMEEFCAYGGTLQDFVSNRIRESYDDSTRQMSFSF
jgi:hypothetical protein